MRCKLCGKHLSKPSRTGLCSACGSIRLSTLVNDENIEVILNKVLIHGLRGKDLLRSRK